MRCTRIDSIMNSLDRVIKSRKETKMANRLKRVFSTVLCAMVLLTMTAVPGTAFAETTDEPEKAAQTETQALSSEN